jgi:hypothetical protein
LKNRDESGWGSVVDEEMFTSSAGPWADEAMFS